MFHEQVDAFMKTETGAVVVATKRQEILAGRSGVPPASTPKKAATGDSRPSDYGPNTAQIQALFDWIATLDSEVWLGLVLAQMMQRADPSVASPENRAFIRELANGVRTTELITSRVREAAMRSGVWQQIEASVIATAGPQMGLAIDAAKKRNPDATPEELAEALGAYAEPIGGLTHALRLRPYVREEEFLLLWGVYEASEHRLADLRATLPPLDAARMVAPLTTATRSGGCLVSNTIGLATVAYALWSLAN